MFAVLVTLLGWARVYSTGLCPILTRRRVGYKNSPVLPARAMTVLTLMIGIVEVLQPAQRQTASLPHALSSRHYDALRPAYDEKMHQHHASPLATSQRDHRQPKSPSRSLTLASVQRNLSFW